MSYFRLATATVSFIALSGVAFAQTSTAVTKADIPALVKEALMNDPEIIMQALEKLRVQKAEQAKKEAEDTLVKNSDAIYKNANIPSVGPADADVSIVEFFDYHCGYCKHFLPELAKIMEEDKKLRVLFIDFPILSEDSVTAARAAIAVNRLDKSKYFDFHTALMKESGKYDEKKILEIAKKVGVKGDLKAEMAKPEVTALLDSNRELAQKLQISGTPGLIVGKEVIPGALSYDELKNLIANLRNPKPAAAAPTPAAAPAPAAVPVAPVAKP